MDLWTSVAAAHLDLAKKISADPSFSKRITKTANIISQAIACGGKILLFGNGGSAADAQHIAAEFVGKFRFDREPITAMALTTNTSILTAISNDFDFSGVFSRQVSMIISEKDIAIGISTSGFSKNVINGLLAAKRANAFTVLLSGKNHAPQIADSIIAVPSEDTPRIQEMHILIGHYLAEYVERETMHLCAETEK